MANRFETRLSIALAEVAPAAEELRNWIEREILWIFRDPSLARRRIQEDLDNVIWALDNVQRPEGWREGEVLRRITVAMTGIGASPQPGASQGVAAPVVNRWSERLGRRRRK